MRFTVKGLGTFSLELEMKPEDTVLMLKNLLAETLGKPASQMKLIRLGKILIDESTLAVAGVKSNDQLILMIEQAKAAPRPQPAPVASAQPAPVQAAAPVKDFIPESELRIAPSANVQVSPEALSQLLTLGFPYDQCEKALRVAQGDVQGAIELLMTRPDEDFDPNATFDINSEEIQELIRKPAFVQLREILIARPQLLGQVLEQIEMSNPQLATMIARFPEEFKRLLTEPLPAPEEQPVPQQAIPAPEVRLTEAEEAEVQSLVAFGFRYEDALEVYLTCGKSVDTAATYLFENYKPS